MYLQFFFRKYIDSIEYQYLTYLSSNIPPGSAADEAQDPGARGVRDQRLGDGDVAGAHRRVPQAEVHARHPHACTNIAIYSLTLKTTRPHIKMHTYSCTVTDTHETHKPHKGPKPRIRN